MIEPIKHWLTGRDNSTYSLSKIIVIFTVAAMLFNFIKTGSVDFQGLGIGVTGILAAMAAKFFVEKPEAK